MPLNNEDREILVKHYMQKSEEALTSSIRDLEFNAYNSAANRAYYSIFHAEKALLVTKGILGDSHKHVHNSISKEFVKAGILPSDMYSKVQISQRIRHVGDYSTNQSVKQEEAQKVIKIATEFYEVTQGLVEKFLMEQNNRLSEEDIRQNRLAAISSAKEVMGDRIFVTNAMNGEYSGEIIAKTDVYAIQRITDNQAVLHELTDLPGGIDIEIGEKITLHRNEGKTVLSVQDNSIEEGQER